MKSDSEPEAVLFVHDFWDQPRAGIANFGGVPHRFLCPFDDCAEYYLLDTIAEDALNLEREAWDIYYGHSPAPELPSILPTPIPRFPNAKPRYDEIQLLLADASQAKRKALQ